MESVIVLPCAATGDSAAGASASTTRSATATPAKLREIVIDRPSSASGASRMARRYATLPGLSSGRDSARGAGIQALHAEVMPLRAAGVAGSRVVAMRPVAWPYPDPPEPRGIQIRIAPGPRFAHA